MHSPDSYSGVSIKRLICREADCANGSSEYGEDSLAKPRTLRHDRLRPEEHAGYAVQRRTIRYRAPLPDEGIR